MHKLRKQKRDGDRQQREMEQSTAEAHQQQKQLQTPLECPRCGSLDTIFRYFNNNSLTQPRRHCRTCRRQWTVGGRLRLIPVGGNTRSGKPTKASSSRGGNSRSQPTQALLSLGEEHQQHLIAAMLSQNFVTTLFQPITNMPAAISPLNYFSNQISCLDARTLFCSAGTNMTIPQGWNVQTMAPQQALSQQNSMTFEPYQTPPSLLSIDSVVQPAWPMNLLPQQQNSTTMSNACLQNNLSGDTTDAEDTTYVNVDEWLNFRGCDPS